MKKTILIMALISVLLVVMAIADSGHGDFSEAIEILENKVPYEDLTDDDFEVLGDYFMELQMGDRHEIMDEMMGGEGSESLRQAHINMGRNFYANYLNDGVDDYNGMMGPGMMQGSNFGYMMYPGSGHMFFGFGGLFWLIVIALLIWFIIWLSKQNISQKNPLEILKTRYAKGEITKKEFESMKKRLAKR